MCLTACIDVFIILAESSAAIEPRDCCFDDPADGVGYKAMLLRIFGGDLDPTRQFPLDVPRKTSHPIRIISHGACEPWICSCLLAGRYLFDCQLPTLTIRHICCMDRYLVEIAPRVRD